MNKLILVTTAALALGACQGDSGQDAAEESSLDGRSETADGTQDSGMADVAAETQDQTGDSESQDASGDPQDARTDAPDVPEQSQSATQRPAAAITTDTASVDAAAGKAVYMATCVACHAPDGTGALPGVPDFTVANGPFAKSDAVLLRNMTNGFQSPGSPMAMPARGGNASLTDEDMANVLAYMKRAFGR